MRFSDLEKLAFEKEAGLVSSVFNAGASLATPIKKTLGGIRAIAGAVGDAAEYATRWPRAALGAGADFVNKGLMSGARLGVGAGLTGASAAAGVATGVGHGLLEGAALPAARWGAGRFAKAPISTTLGAVGAYGSAKHVGDVIGGDVYNSHRMNPYLSTPSASFGTEKFNPLSKFSEEHMATNTRVPRMHELEKLAGPSLTKMQLVAEKMAIPAALAVMAPIFGMMGERAVHHMFTPETRMDAEGLKAKNMAEYEGKELVKKLEAAKKERETRPKMNDIFAAIRKNDKVIHEAYQDPHLKGVLHNTMETVYAFAPDVAKDHRTMQSVLREAITAPDGGLSFQTAKQLAETQKYISESRGIRK